MAQEVQSTRSKGWIALWIVVAIALIVGVLLFLRYLDESEPENIHGATQAGADITPDAAPAPPEGAEGAAGIVNVPPGAQPPDTAQPDAAP